MRFGPCTRKKFPGLLLAYISLAGLAQAKLPDRFGEWQTGSFRPVTEAQLAEFAGTEAALLREYGFVSGEQREYVRGDARLSATLWRMKDVSGSFGLFSFYREPEMQGLEGEERMALGKDRAILHRGLYVVDAQGAQLTAAEATLLLAEVPPPRRGENLLPSLASFLPEQGLVAGSAKYLLGPVAFARLEKDLPSSAIGFDLGAEAELAQYQVDNRRVRLLLVSYATPQLAARRLQSLERLPVIAHQIQGKAVYIQRKGSLLCFVLDAPVFATAEALLSRFGYESTVTWNEYVPSPRDNAADLIWNMFLLAGFVLLFAFVAGISFGGVRILTKRFVRIPIFDRPSQMEIIRLHLTEKS